MNTERFTCCEHCPDPLPDGMFHRAPCPHTGCAGADALEAIA